MTAGYRTTYAEDQAAPLRPGPRRNKCGVRFSTLISLTARNPRFRRCLPKLVWAVRDSAPLRYRDSPPPLSLAPGRQGHRSATGNGAPSPTGLGWVATGDAGWNNQVRPSRRLPSAYREQLADSRSTRMPRAPLDGGRQGWSRPKVVARGLVDDADDPRGPSPSVSLNSPGLVASDRLAPTGRVGGGRSL
jgi:hypothetical protein